MADITLVVGGSVSGKSAYAEKIARESQNYHAKQVAYLATGVILDEEFALRVEEHKKRRPREWKTVEEPLHLAEAVKSLSGEYQVVLIDGIGTWVTNFVMEYHFRQDMADYFNKELQLLKETLNDFPGWVILVADEVGNGLIPETKESRIFRDLNGSSNQELALLAHEVVQVVCGIPVKIK